MTEKGFDIAATLPWQWCEDCGWVVFVQRWQHMFRYGHLPEGRVTKVLP